MDVLIEVTVLSVLLFFVNIAYKYDKLMEV